MLLQPSQVTFTRIRYHEALQRWKWQKKVGQLWCPSSSCHKPREHPAHQHCSALGGVLVVGYCQAAAGVISLGAAGYEQTSDDAEVSLCTFSLHLQVIDRGLFVVGAAGLGGTYLLIKRLARDFCMENLWRWSHSLKNVRNFPFGT